MSKRILSLLIIGLLVLPVFALAAESDAPKTKGFTYTAQQISDPPYTIGLSNYSIGNSWRVQMIEEAKYRAKQYPNLIENLVVTNAKGSIAKQISDIEDLITKGVDAILVTAKSPKALSPVIEKAVEKGIVVVDFDNTVETEKTTSSVVVNQKAFGRVGAEWLVKELNGEGKIVVLNGVKGTSTSQLRWAGAKEVFNKNPGIEILQKVYADWGYAKAKSAMEDVLSAYPNIDGIWSQGGAMTQAAIDAFKEHGRSLVPMTGEDNNGFLKDWKEHKGEGDFAAISASMPTYISAISLDVALNALRGQQYFHQYVVPIPTITAEEVQDYVKPDLPDSYWTNSRLPKDVVKKLFER